MNIGDYIRTNRGIIAKIIKVNSTGSITCDRSVYYGFNVVNSKRILKDFSSIIKSSPNIIDLIEVGDILKFKDTKHYQEVLAIDNEKLYLTEYIYMSGLHKYKKEIQEDLEWVITHEQIEAIQYKVGE